MRVQNTQRAILATSGQLVIFVSLVLPLALAVSATALAQVANDSCVNAGAIVAVPSTNTVVTTAATTEAADPFPACGNGSRGRSVWYRFTAPNIGTLTANTSGSTYDTILSAYRGACGGFTAVAGGCNDDAANTLQSRVSIATTAGATYYFLVTAYNNTGGTLTFQLSFQGTGNTATPTWTTQPQPPAATSTAVLPAATFTPTRAPTAPNPVGLVNDACTSALVIATVPYAGSVSTSAATTAVSDPSPACGNGSRARSVWYQFTASSNGVISANTFGSSYDTILSAYTGTCGALSRVANACSDDAGGSLQSQVSFNATGRATYSFMVSAYSSNAGTLRFQLSFQPAASTATPTPSATVTSTPSASRTATRPPSATFTATARPTPPPTASPTRIPVTSTPTSSPVAGSTPPIVPAIDATLKARLRAVFLSGQAAGNRAGVFAKLGDSITESGSFLKDIGCGVESLGTHTDLAPIIDYFRSTTFPNSYTSVWCEVANSFTRDSVSAVAGWSADAALQPATIPGCPAPYDTALQCELHLIHPSIALIMYGTNDLERFNDLNLYRSDLTAIVTLALSAGVIPLLSTIPPRLDDPTLGARVASYNYVVVDVARTQQVPLLDYWQAMTGPQMVHQGISDDGVHPNLYGGCAPDCLSADLTDAGLRYGYNQRNFTAIAALGKLKAIVIDDGPADGSGPTATNTPAPSPTPTRAASATSPPLASTPTRTPLVTASFTATPTVSSDSGGPAIAGCAVFPADNPWNRDISNDPVDPNSANYIASINLGATHLHADFGSPADYGIPYVVVPGSQPMVPITFTEYGDESDPGPYPVPPTAPIEAGSDHHVLVLDSGNCTLYEMYHATKDSGGPGWFAGSGAIFNLESNALRPDGWTSCDEAGLPILPGLVRYDEVAAGVIKHAARFTVWRTQRAWVHPATHYGTSSNVNDPPMGMRVRLKASFDVSPYYGQAHVVLEALKKYGMFVADTGSSWFITGATDPRWNDTDLDQLKTIPGSAFEVVQLGPVYRP